MLSLSEEIQFHDSIPSSAVRVATAYLPSLPNPEDSIHFLNRLFAEAPDAAAEFAADAMALRYALTIFSYSRFLADAVIRYPGWLLDIARARDLHRGFLEEQYEEQLQALLPPDGVPQPVDLALFRRRQLLRIVLRDVLRFADLSETTEDLSNLADAILNAAWRAIRKELSREYLGPSGPGNEPAFSVISLGKLGGRELNYSSDIDLMFVYAGNGETEGRRDHQQGILQEGRQPVSRSCSRPTRRRACAIAWICGCGRTDAGRDLPSRWKARSSYYATRARDWEKQMLIKARVSAGEPGPGPRSAGVRGAADLLRATLDFRAVEAVSETRQRISEKLAARSAPQSGLDVKLTPGGIRDIEFLVQCLQRLHGGREPWVRHGGTLLALFRLRDKGLLSARNTRACRRPTSSCATWSIGCRWTRTARPTRSHRDRG